MPKLTKTEVKDLATCTQCGALPGQRCQGTSTPGASHKRRWAEARRIVSGAPPSQDEHTAVVTCPTCDRVIKGPGQGVLLAVGYPAVLQQAVCAGFAGVDLMATSSENLRHTADTALVDKFVRAQLQEAADEIDSLQKRLGSLALDHLALLGQCDEMKEATVEVRLRESDCEHVPVVVVDGVAVEPKVLYAVLS